MGILTYVKIGAAVVIIAVLGYFVWNYQHMQTKIVALQEKVAGLELRAEVIEKAQKATDTFMKKKTAVQARVVKEKANVDQVVESGDDAGMRNLFINQGLLRAVAPKPAPLPR
jgi:Tfp pilus assembly protein PilN